ncbi:hypothetical protein HYH03_004807 [Edaphochlamys debaryana]|uniref:Photolyase/cryptochrome alpha/beta domain-containing protein n=1 Tax=Edaphochlamys debaryana TaxID=47281 RepID=A0A836C2Y5_9CHLO|nr:hypothetical protein HYH03_004807 [Edaphochlamys debaryana]|eukprot:KAG2497218.1 hypothetical protein HYH03_004807 [Edaphochlamys debaryana]
MALAMGLGGARTAVRAARSSAKAVVGRPLASSASTPRSSGRRELLGTAPCPRSPTSAPSTPARPLPAAHASAAPTDAAATPTPSPRRHAPSVAELASRLDPATRGPVVLWFRNDLRIDDHPGLTAAAAACMGQGAGGAARPLAPVFVLDPSRLYFHAFNAGGPEALSAALERLRADLRSRGSDLALVVGCWEEALPGAARALGAAAVVSEEEVELRWRGPSDDALARASEASGAQAFGWDAPVWPAASFDTRYRSWLQGRGAAAEPIPPPAALPPFPSGLEPGRIPDGAEMRRLLTEAALAACGPDAAVASTARAVMEAAAAGPEAERARRVLAGPASPLELLRLYLRTAPPPPPDSPSASVSIDDEVAALRRPGVEGAPFTGLFSAAKALGSLSARRVLKEAFAADGRPYGSVEPRRLRSPEAVAAGVAAEAADFHRALAVLDDDRVLAPGVEVHFWRWRGGLTDYCVAEPSNPLPGAPALLLVHGFGAFGDQWGRSVMSDLAAAGFRVFAPTFPGFGRSQKASVPYSQDLWRDFLRDFTLEVVRAPVVLAGNSIGGFISTSMAADYPGLVRGLVLLNSAGPVDPGFDEATWRKAVAAGRKAPPKLLVQALASALFWYLERTVPSTLRWLYPTNPDRADKWLQQEILRAAGDSGAIDVFKAVFYLPPPRPLNFLIRDMFRGPTFILQGALDPLNESTGRAMQLQELCPNVTVRMLQAGHCPHDEVPELVTAGLLDFVRDRVLGAPAAGGSERQAAAVGATVSAAAADK